MADEKTMNETFRFIRADTEAKLNEVIEEYLNKHAVTGDGYEEFDEDGRELRHPIHWADHFNTCVMDPDGWRCDKKPFSDLVTKEEFADRWVRSTCRQTPTWELIELVHRNDDDDIKLTAKKVFDEAESRRRARDA